MVTAVVTVFIQGLSRSTAAASELLGSSFGGIVVSDRFSVYNQLPTQQRQLCWAHLIRDLVAICRTPGRQREFGAELLGLQRQLFGHWHRHNKNGSIDWPALQQSCRPIRQAFEATLQRVVELSCQRSERDRTPWASTGRTCLPAAPEGGRWVMDLPDDRGKSSPPTTPLCGRCASRGFNARSVTASTRPVVPPAGAACSRPQPPSGIRAENYGSSWSRPGSPITVAGRRLPYCRIPERLGSRRVCLDS
jgi:hypothetical protein